MNGAGLFFLLLFLLVIIPALGFVGFTRWRAHKRGLPAPPLSAYNPFKAFSKSNNNGSSSMGRGGSGSGGGGPMGWIKDKFAALRDHRAGSGYAGARRGERGFGPLDPDAAWDDRVALEADDVVGADGYHGERGGGRGGAGNRGPYGGDGGYEEQELGMRSPPPRDHGPYGMHGNGGAAMPGYGEEERGRSRSREDLSYHGAASLGQEELDTRYDQTVHGGGGLRPVSPRPAETSPGPQFERRSMFREDV